MAVERIIFIRPGETDWNKQGRWQGWVATPLNEHGRRQAESLARFLRTIGMSALYSSDLRRAMQTAEILCRVLGYEAIPDERLRERNIGLWQGLTLDEMRAWYADEYESMLKDVNAYRVPAGESRDEVRARMKSAYNDIMQQARGETVGILTHTTALKVLLEDLFPGYDAIGANLGNTSVTTMRRKGDSWTLVAVDDCLHLEGLRTAAVSEIEANKT
ncbi:MAG: histidine phosphatase family protein [Anaerolinea sp.]|nr:histidine phosphatase family protein [Anaerolinea sp.]